MENFENRIFSKQDILTSDFHDDYEVSATQRGRPKLIHQGFSFTAHVIYKDDPFKYWHCDQRWKGCKVRGVLTCDGKLSLRGNHNHGPKTPAVLMLIDQNSKDPTEFVLEYSHENQ